MIIKIIKNIFLVSFLIIGTLLAEDKILTLPKVTVEYVTNTLFKTGILDIRTRTFHAKNLKRIDSVVENIPISVVIDYEKQVATYIWPKTFSYVSVKLNPETQEKLKKLSKIVYLEKIDLEFIHGFETDVFKVKMKLADGTIEESTRWITKHGVTLKEIGIIEGKEGKLHFLSEFSNVKVFKQDRKIFEVPENYKLAPTDQLEDINELLKLMVKRT